MKEKAKEQREYIVRAYGNESGVWEVGFHSQEFKDWMDVLTFDSPIIAQEAADKLQHWYDIGALL